MTLTQLHVITLRQHCYLSGSAQHLAKQAKLKSPNFRVQILGFLGFLFVSQLNAAYTST